MSINILNLELIFITNLCFQDIDFLKDEKNFRFFLF